jgi:hypothetical protein
MVAFKREAVRGPHLLGTPVDEAGRLRYQGYEEKPCI